MNEQLTKDQIEHWRNALVATIGPYALIMPDDQIQKIRDKMQEQFVEQTKEKE